MEPQYVDAYSYDPQTGELTGLSKAWENPLVPGEFMLPASATFSEPPPFQEGKVRVWNGSSWTLVDAPDPSGYTENPLTTEQLEANMRYQRNQLLAMTDWTQLPDVPISSTSRYAFMVYRQELRDLSAQPGFPQEVNWPGMPPYVKRD